MKLVLNDIFLKAILNKLPDEKKKKIILKKLFKK